MENFTDHLIQTRRVIVTCGTGGVGKTTLSAAIGLRACQLGKKAIVVTIDPAKRLVTALGLDTLGNQAVDLTEKVTKKGENGKFFALMPNSKKTFEAFFSRIAPSPSIAQKILSNPIIEMISTEFSGADEYIAVEKLHEIYSSHQFDTIIIDTPPSRNVLSFLEAPAKLNHLFEEKLIKMVLKPTGRFFTGGIKKVLGVFEKLTGGLFFSQLIEFGNSLFQTQAGFVKTMSFIHSLLQSEEVGFVLAASATPDTIQLSKDLIHTIQEKNYHFDGVILNRTYSGIKDSPHPHPNHPGIQLIQKIQEKEKEIINQLKSDILLPNVVMVPVLSRDIHSMEDLLYVADALEKARSC